MDLKTRRSTKPEPFSLCVLPVSMNVSLQYLVLPCSNYWYEHKPVAERISPLSGSTKESLFLASLC